MPSPPGVDVVVVAAVAAAVAVDIIVALQHRTKVNLEPEVKK